MIVLQEAREAAQARIDALGEGLSESYGSIDEAAEHSDPYVLLSLLLVGEDLAAPDVAEWLAGEADDVLDGLALDDEDRAQLRAELIEMGIRVLLVARLAR